MTAKAKSPGRALWQGAIPVACAAAGVALIEGIRAVSWRPISSSGAPATVMLSAAGGASTATMDVDPIDHSAVCRLQHPIDGVGTDKGGGKRFLVRMRLRIGVRPFRRLCRCTASFMAPKWAAGAEWDRELCRSCLRCRSKCRYARQPEPVLTIDGNHRKTRTRFVSSSSGPPVLSTIRKLFVPECPYSRDSFVKGEMTE